VIFSTNLPAEIQSIIDRQQNSRTLYTDDYFCQEYYRKAAGLSHQNLIDIFSE